METIKVQVDDYSVHILQKVGKGSYGTVYKASNKKYPGVDFAAKQIEGDVRKNNINALREAVICKRVTLNNFNWNILQVFDVLEDEEDNDHGQGATNEETEQNKRKSITIWIFSEFCTRGDLNKYFEEHFEDVKTPASKAQLMHQISNGLSHLHQQNIVHRDIKPGNILIQMKHDGVPVARLADFGLSKWLDTDKSTMSTDTGTQMFKAPEFWGGKKIEYRNSIDIFAAGLTFLAMLQASDENRRLSPKAEGTLDEVLESKQPIGFIMHLRKRGGEPPLQLVLHYIGEDRVTKMSKGLVQDMVCMDHKDRIDAQRLTQRLLEILNIALTEVRDIHSQYTGLGRSIGSMGSIFIRFLFNYNQLFLFTGINQY